MCHLQVPIVAKKRGPNTEIRSQLLFRSQQTAGCELSGFLKLESKCMAQLGDHNRGRLPTKCRDPATVSSDTCTASLCEQASPPASHFPPQEFVPRTQREPPDTRHPAPHQKSPQCLLSPSHLARSSAVPRPGVREQLSDAHRKLFLRPWPADKRRTQRGSANTVITCHAGFRQPIGGEDCPSLGCQTTSIHRVATGGGRSSRGDTVGM